MLTFWAYRARREGKPIPRWHLPTVDWKRGQLTVREERDDWLGRTVRVARVTGDQASAVLPPLIDAVLLDARADRMVLTGIERDELTRCDRAQTWVLLPSRDPREGAKRGTVFLTFWAYRARREGKPIPRWQLPTIDWSRGTLSLGEERDDLLGRTVRVARVTNEREAEVFPPLIEAQLIHVDHHRMVLTGIERDELTSCDRAQTWVLLSQDARRGAEAGGAAKADESDAG